MLSLKDLQMTYGDKQLFNGLTLHMEANDKLLISAPSGSGKSTLIKLILGFEKPLAGEIVIFDNPLNRHNLKYIRSQIAYVSQDADLVHDTLEHMVDEVLSYKVNKHIENGKETFKHYLSLFNMDGAIIHKKSTQLSGGERQRAALALALTLDRPMLILDEITSGLDHDLKVTIAKYLIDIEKTLLIISHDDIWQQFNLREVATL